MKTPEKTSDEEIGAELIARLNKQISKVLGLEHYNSYEVAEVMNDAVARIADLQRERDEAIAQKDAWSAEIERNRAQWSADLTALRKAEERIAELITLVHVKEGVALGLEERIAELTRERDEAMRRR